MIQESNILMNIKVTHKDLYNIIVPQEKHFGSHEASELKTAVREARQSTDKTIVLDFSQIKTIDSNGFSSLLVTNRECQEVDTNLIIINTSSTIGKLLRISHLDEILVVKVNEWDAINSIISEGSA